MFDYFSVFNYASGSQESKYLLGPPMKSLSPRSQRRRINWRDSRLMAESLETRCMLAGAPPVAQPDAYFTNEDQSLNVDLPGSFSTTPVLIAQNSKWDFNDQ